VNRGRDQGAATLRRVEWQHLKCALSICDDINGKPTAALYLPLQLTAAEVRRLEAAEGGRDGLVDSLDSLKQQVANVE
jgi:hypothetical protein